MQRGVLEVVSPIQEGASRALKPVARPVRLGRGHVRRQGRASRTCAPSATRCATAAVGRRRRRCARTARSRSCSSCQDDAGLKSAQPVTARVIGQDAERLVQPGRPINKGTSDGVRANQPVVDRGGLVGVVKVDQRVVGRSSIVCSSPTTRRRSRRASTRAACTGVVQVEAGRPTDLRPRVDDRGNDKVAAGQTVVTVRHALDAGRVQSLFPPNIPIGRVTRVDDRGHRRPGGPPAPVRRPAPARASSRS